MNLTYLISISSIDAILPAVWEWVFFKSERKWSDPKTDTRCMQKYRYEDALWNGMILELFLLLAQHLSAVSWSWNQLPTNRLCIQQFEQANSNKIIAPLYWPFVWGIHYLDDSLITDY